MDSHTARAATALVGAPIEIDERELVSNAKLAAIGELSAGVAHELNNPLFAILGLVELLLADGEAGTKSHGRLELVHRTALEIKEIVRALLDFAREAPDAHRTVALDETAEATVELVRLTSPARGIELEVETAGDGPFLVEGSPNRLMQVFLHLVAESRRALPDAGRISIRLERRDGFVTATVHGRGDGDGGTAKPSQLGLAASNRIAESHGGSLTATRAPDGSTAFSLRLPYHDAR